MGMFMGVAALFFHDVYGLTASDMGKLFCAAGITMIFMQALFAKRIAAILGKPVSTACGFILRMFNFCLVARVEASWVPLAFCVVTVAAGAFIDPCLSSLASDNAPKSMSGIALGTFQAFAFLGRFVGPVVAGAVYTSSTVAAFEYAACVCAVSLVPAVWLIVLGHRHATAVGTEPADLGEAMLQQDEELEVLPPTTLKRMSTLQGFSGQVFTLPPVQY